MSNTGHAAALSSTVGDAVDDETVGHGPKARGRYRVAEDSCAQVTVAWA